MAEGLVTQFDDAAGFGEIETADGTRYFFHCTRIADGTRTIAVGTPVTFDVVAGHLGRWEATAVAPTPTSPPR
jgi:cold shock CspA family protein